jgi:hypothetical protein
MSIQQWTGVSQEKAEETRNSPVALPHFHNKCHVKSPENVSEALL